MEDQEKILKQIEEILNRMQGLPPQHQWVIRGQELVSLYTALGEMIAKERLGIMTIHDKTLVISVFYEGLSV